MRCFLRTRFVRAAAIAALIGLAAAEYGCTTRAELVSLREGMDQSTGTIRRQHLEWAELLSQGKQSQLPTLSPEDYRAVLRANQEYQDLVNASRAQDGTTAPGANQSATTAATGP